MEVRPKEVSRRLRSSPPAFGETWASKRGVKPSLGGCNSPVRSMKRSLPRRQHSPRKGTNREPSPALEGEGRGRGEELGSATPKNPAAYGAWNGETAIGKTGEARLRPSSETSGVPSERWPGSDEPYKRYPREVGQSGAGVGAAHSTDEAGQCPSREGAVLGLRTRGEVSAGECPAG